MFRHVFYFDSFRFGQKNADKLVFCFYRNLRSKPLSLCVLILCCFLCFIVSCVLFSSKSQKVKIIRERTSPVPETVDFHRKNAQFFLRRHTFYFETSKNLAKLVVFSILNLTEVGLLLVVRSCFTFLCLLLRVYHSGSRLEVVVTLAGLLANTANVNMSDVRASM